MSFGSAITTRTLINPEYFLKLEFPGRSRTFAAVHLIFCASTNTWVDLQYVVLIKRYRSVRHLYVEIWKAVAPVGDEATPVFGEEQEAPETYGLQGTMEFMANAQASPPGPAATGALGWQNGLPPTCNISFPLVTSF